MRVRSVRAIVAMLCVVASAATAGVALWLRDGFVRNADQNGDGRPDAWFTYDRDARLTEVAIDTNFDGRADVQEYYVRGVLTRRESDRDFNDRVDLVEQFDASTREHLRSVVDVDFDGVADLLVLFRDGQPVFSKWARITTPAVESAYSVRTAAASSRESDHSLAPFDDPFLNTLAVRAGSVDTPSADGVGLSTSGGLPASYLDILSLIAPSSHVSGCNTVPPSPAPLLLYSPRGPPALPRSA